MKGKRSLQRTLSLGLTAGVTVLWLLGVLASGMVAQHEMEEVFDSALQETAQRILPLAVTDILSRESDRVQKTAPAMADHDEYLTYLIRDASGTVLLQSHDVDLSVFNERPGNGFYNTATHRLYGTSAVSQTIFIDIAEPLMHRQEAALEAGIALLLPLLLLIPVSLLGVWWTVRFSLRRVVDFSESLEVRGAADLSPVPVDQLPQELEPMAVSINRLLERLRRVLDAERSFTANSAHELRTPLATALAKVQRLKADLSETPSLRKVAEIEASLQGLSRLSQKLLELAKAEGGGVLSETPYNLVPVLETVVSDCEREEPGRLILQRSDAPVNSLLNPDAFAILVRNLIDNALKHGEQGSPVKVALSADGKLAVTNRGTALGPDELAGLRKRFVRSHTQAPGSGIGLAIVDAIVEGAGLHLVLRSPAPEQQDGFQAELNVVVSR
ncbi:MAG: ATP-binding protein [Saccharospirillum sp.]|uniref:sensor histidine kinase n=1 Tax=Saccharospirillum sp. TaxID=2033801 RepID=UPI003296ABB8